MPNLTSFTPNAQSTIRVFGGLFRSAATADLVTIGSSITTNAAGQVALANLLFGVYGAQQGNILTSTVTYPGYAAGTTATAFAATLVDTLTAGTSISTATRDAWKAVVVQALALTTIWPTRGDVAVTVMNLIDTYTGTDPDLIAANNVMDNRVEAAAGFALTTAGATFSSITGLITPVVNVTDVASSIPVATGTTFTLTTGIDNAAGQAAITGFLSNTTSRTWGLTDSLTGTSGTGDTLSVSLIADDTGLATTYAALSTSGIENIAIKYVDGLTGTATTDLGTASFTGLTKLTVSGGTIANASAADTLTLSSIAAGVALEYGNNAKLLDINANFVAAATAGSADTVKLALTGGREGTLTVGTSGTGFETAAITTSNASNRATDLVGATIKTVTVAGTDLRVDEQFDTTVTSFDASTATGTINVNFAPGATFTAKGGTGTTDVVTVSALSATSVVSGFETVVASAAGTYDLTGVTGATKVGVQIGSGAVFFTNAAATQNNLQLSGGFQRTVDAAATGNLTAGAGVTFALKDGSGTSDTLNVTLDNGGLASTGTYTLGGALTATTIENINITSADWKGVTIANITQTLSGTGSATVKATGAATFSFGTLNAATASTTASDVFDFSGVTGKTTETIGSAGNVTFTGGSGIDTVTNTLLAQTTGTAKVQTFTLGAGNDVMTANVASSNVVDKLTVDAGAGDDIISIGLAAGAINSGTVATFSVAGGDGTDTLRLGTASWGVVTGAITGIEKINFENANTSASTTLALTVPASYADTVVITDVSGTTSGVSVTSAGAVSLANWTALGWTTATDTLAVSGSGTVTGPSAALNTSISGGASADALTGGSGADTLVGGAGADTLAGGAGADVFQVVAGNSPSTGFDAITGYATTEVIDETGTAITLASTATVGAGTAGFGNADGVAATFNAADSTFALHLAAVEMGIRATANGAGEAGIWVEGAADTYLFISDGVTGVGANDILIKLTGITGTDGALDVLTLGGANAWLA